MPLSDEEALVTYRSIADMLRDARLGWVVDDVEAQIALGKVRTKRMTSREISKSVGRDLPMALDFPEFAERYPEEAKPRRGRAAAFFTVAEDYTPQEQLKLIVDALELAVPTLNDIAASVTDFFQTISGEANVEVAGAIEFFSFEPERESKRSFSLRPSDVREHREAAKRLGDLLNELKRELGYAPTS